MLVVKQRLCFNACSEVDSELPLIIGVQELLAAGIVQQFQADDYKFSSAGREDIDVRPLQLGLTRQD
jgi:tRNA U54 and U55 pseudouridine synthase Pus10